jgi:methylase of polypeptide subunit release factors
VTRGIVTYLPPEPVAPASARIDVSAVFAPLRPFVRLRGDGPLMVRCDDGTYDPKADPAYDWVHRVAIPVFRSVAGRRPVASFCTVGTGTGCDALAAIEVFAPERVALTDLALPTVAHAALNVLDNVRPGGAVDVVTGAGDLLAPFGGSELRFDLIYENLPNLPLTGQRAGSLRGRDHATYHHSRTEEVPLSARESLLELHWLCLHQARSLLAPGGILLSSIGARRPLAEICAAMTYLATAQRIELLTWKLQSEPAEVIGGFAAEEHPRRQFSFYSAEVLDRVLEATPPTEAAACAFDIEAALAPHRMTAAEALVRSRHGEPIGHTVIVLASEPDGSGELS